jgi:hypothetical protein
MHQRAMKPVPPVINTVSTDTSIDRRAVLWQAHDTGHSEGLPALAKDARRFGAHGSARRTDRPIAGPNPRGHDSVGEVTPAVHPSDVAR